MPPEPQLKNVDCLTCAPADNAFMEHVGTVTDEGTRYAIFVCQQCKRHRRVAFGPRSADEPQS